MIRIDKDRIPAHIGIIMDGNGRWSKKRFLPRSAGHAAGAETLRRISKTCSALGVRYLTVYAFSTENWKRPVEEVSGIIELLRKYLLESIEKMEKDGIGIEFFGDLTPFSPDLREFIAEVREISKRIGGLQVNICLNYGGRDEIVRAAGRLTRRCVEGGLDPDGITEELMSAEMYTSGMPEPDLIIRPSGELRLSNFMLWQSAYSELYFSDVLWPDFSDKELYKAIADFQKRQRRFGGI